MARIRSGADDCCLGIAYCYLSSVVVAAGVLFGTDILPQQSHWFQDISPTHSDSPGLIGSFTQWDGVWYAQIARQGYSYGQERRSNVAFFPAYPLLGAAVARVTGLEAGLSLLLVSQCCLVGAFIVAAAYIRVRFSEAAPDLTDCALLALGLWPTTLFFRMSYSESLFLLITLLAMYGMHRKWPLLLIALIVGLATATRAVGLALVPAFGLFLWQHSRSTSRFAFRAVILLPVACWGLIAYMAYQEGAFGDPLAFVKTQEHWVRQPASLGQKLPALIGLEPIWSVYVPSSPMHWASPELVGNPLFSLQFANPIYFVVTAALIGLGLWRRWLDGREGLLSILLLVIPYVSLGYENGMRSQGRFAAVVFPAYIVLGHLAARAPLPVTIVGYVFSACILGVYSALFAAWYRIF